MITGIVAVAATMLAFGAPGQPSSGRTNAAERSDRDQNVVVDAPDRQVCRAVRRTATRMRIGRVCRTVAQWEAARQGRSEEDEMAEAAERLDVLGADDASTGDTGGMGSDMDTPLGPR